MLPDSLPLLRRRDDKQYVFASKAEQSFTKKYQLFLPELALSTCQTEEKTSACRQILWSECNFGTRQQEQEVKKKKKKEAFYNVFAHTWVKSWRAGAIREVLQSSTLQNYVNLQHSLAFSIFFIYFV